MIVLQHDRVEITFHTQVHTDLAHLRRYNRHAGEYERLVDANGDWTTVDRSEGDNNTFSVAPPSSLQPTLVPAEYHVNRYVERPVRDDPRVVKIDVQFVRTEPRDVDESLPSESQGTDDWLFTFNRGRIATPYVERTDQGNGRDIELVMSLSSGQVEALLENATRLDAVRVVEVPEGDDFIRDAHPDDRNTVSISQPASINSEYLPTDGAAYVIRDWRVEKDGPTRYRVRMTVRERP